MIPQHRPSDDVDMFMSLHVGFPRAYIQDQAAVIRLNDLVNLPGVFVLIHKDAASAAKPALGFRVALALTFKRSSLLCHLVLQDLVLPRLVSLHVSNLRQGKHRTDHMIAKPQPEQHACCKPLQHAVCRLASGNVAHLLTPAATMHTGATADVVAASQQVSAVAGMQQAGPVHIETEVCVAAMVMPSLSQR